jgi:hypothetical protein
MSSSFSTWEGVLGFNPTTAPYVAQIPRVFKQGDSAVWRDPPFVDANGVAYDNASYTLKYALAGPIAAPVILTAVASGSDWQTALTTTQSAALLPGIYWWQAQVFATNVRITVDEGELTVDKDFALVGANFDNSTVAEKALAAAEAALSVFQASGGRVQSYTIGGRHMTFQRDTEILEVVTYWRKRVVTDRSTAGGARDRHIHMRFNRAR